MAIAEQRSFKMGRSLLWSTIKNQAGFPSARQNAYSDEKKRIAVDKPDKHAIMGSGI